jgi:hypothetical protein
MRVEFKMSGGVAHFPGLSKPAVLESDKLTPAQAAELQERVAAADFFALPPTVGQAAPGAADLRTYTISVDDAGRRHTVQAVEPLSTPGLAELVAFLRGLARGGAGS